MGLRGVMCVLAGGWWLWVAHAAYAQVVINEIFENPPGVESVDHRWEFIELYGRPGLDLSGMALVLLKGGADADGDGAPDFGSIIEIDEAFSLNGCVLDEQGFFVLVNTNPLGTASAADAGRLVRAPGYTWLQPDSLDNRRWVNALSFQAAHIPSPLPAGLLDNEGSSTYLLLRARPGSTLGADGRSVYAPGYVWRKGELHDIDLDGHLDVGTERFDPRFSAADVRPGIFEPCQVVDEVAWSHRRGKEYLRDNEHEISDTPGTNPDAISRLRYYPHNPRLGYRTKNTYEDRFYTGFSVQQTRTTDESFIVGNLETSRFPASLLYFDGYDLDGFAQTKAPTDLNAIPYTGACDPEPDHDGYPPPCPPDPAGSYLMTDLAVSGFGLTIGTFNDHPTNRTLRQFRFVPGDFDFDGDVDRDDHAMIVAALGASLDDRLVEPANDTSGGRSVYRWQLDGFQRLSAMLGMDTADGAPGRTGQPGNAPTVTPSDVGAHLRLVNRGQHTTF